MKTGNIIKVVKEWVKTNRAWGFTFCFFSLLIIVINWAGINNDNVEWSDFAANSMLIQDAKHLALLKGNYSRVGFNHPGPAILYILAFGEIVFYDLLHVAKSPFSGQMIAGAMYMAFWLTLMGRIVKRFNQSFINSVFFIVLFSLATTAVPFIKGFHFFSYFWFPILYFFPFAVFMLANARLAVGKFDLLGTMAISAGFLINGHACFIAIVPIMVFVTLVLNFLSNYIFEKRYLVTFKRLLENKQQLFLALGMFFIFLLPIILLTILEYPGPLIQYYQYSKAHVANSFKEALHYVAFYWGGDTGMLWGIFCLFIIFFSIQWGKSMDFLWGVVSMTIASTVAILYYAITGIDALYEPYIGYFYFAATMLLMTTVFYMLITNVSFLNKIGKRITNFSFVVIGPSLSKTSEDQPQSSQSPSAGRKFVIHPKAGLCLFSLIGLFLFIKLTLGIAPDGHLNNPQIKILYDSLSKIKLKDERIAISLPGPLEDWSVFVGLANYAKRNGNPLFCVSQESWDISYTKLFRCSDEEEKSNKLQYVVQTNLPNTLFQNPRKFADFYFIPYTGEYQLTHKNMAKSMGHLITRDDKEYWLSDENAEGWVWSGPYMALRKGEYDVYFNLTVKPLSGGDKMDNIARLDVCKDAGRQILSQMEIQPDDYKKNEFVLNLSLKERETSLEFRIYKFNNIAVEIKDLVIRHKR